MRLHRLLAPLSILLLVGCPTDEADDDVSVDDDASGDDDDTTGDECPGEYLYYRDADGDTWGDPDELLSPY